MSKHIEQFIQTATEEELRELTIQLMEVDNPKLLPFIESLLTFR